MSRALVPLILVALLGCATSSPKPSIAAAGSDASAATHAEIQSLRDELATLTNRVNHLHSELIAIQPEGEFKRLTIDEVHPSDRQFGLSLSPGPMLLCHVVEWNEYGRMLRFTRVADRNFTLESPGHASIDATMAQGGVCNDAGSTRFVMLNLQRDLEPGVAYSLRPRNGVAQYTWVVNDGVQIRSAPSTQHAR